MAVEKKIIRSVRWTESEWKKIEEQAEAAGISPSRYVRQVALGKRSPGGFDQGKDHRLEQLIKDMSKIANNVNQVRRVANQTGDISLMVVKDIRRDLGRWGEKLVKELWDD